MDQATGKPYYFHPVTKETSWTRPWLAPPPPRPPPPGPPPPGSTGGALPSGWQQHMDQATGKQYYFHSVTKETTWTRPAPAPPPPPPPAMQPTLPKASQPPSLPLPTAVTVDRHRF